MRPPSDYPASGDRSLKSVLLHEIQHAIQKHEGFARGGSAAEARTLPEFEQLLKQYMAEHEGRLPSWTEVVPGPEQLEEEAARKVYLRLAGEVEARNTQRRMGMTALPCGHEQRHRFTAHGADRSYRAGSELPQRRATACPGPGHVALR